MSESVKVFLDLDRVIWRQFLDRWWSIQKSLAYFRAIQLSNSLVRNRTKSLSVNQCIPRENESRAGGQNQIQHGCQAPAQYPFSSIFVQNCNLCFVIISTFSCVFQYLISRAFRIGIIHFIRLSDIFSGSARTQAILQFFLINHISNIGSS